MLGGAWCKKESKSFHISGLSLCVKKPACLPEVLCVRCGGLSHSGALRTQWVVMLHITKTVNYYLLLKGALNFFYPCKGRGLEKIQIFLWKSSLHAVLLDWPIISWQKRGGPETFWGLKGGCKIFHDKIFLHQPPPFNSVCERSLTWFAFNRKLWKNITFWGHPVFWCKCLGKYSYKCMFSWMQPISLSMFCIPYTCVISKQLHCY